VSGLVIRPNILYVVHPGDRRDRADAVVLGVETAITL
jgi:carbohydrate-selective porin OprB